LLNFEFLFPMHISWLGGTAIKLQFKTYSDDVVVVIDPYSPEQGNFPRSLTANLAIFTRGQKDAVTISGNPFILDTPGECDVKGVLVTATTGSQPTHTMIRLDAENLSIAHLGLAQKALTEEQRDVLSNIDILFVPIGGLYGYDVEAAVKAVNDLEPRVIIPIACQSENDPTAATAAQFCKEMGVAMTKEPETKIIIKKKDLPTEDTTVIVLAKE